MTQLHPLLNVSNLTKDYLSQGKLIRVVDNVSFKVLPGEIVGIGGESGCGKSTIAKILMGLIHPSKGSILFDEKPLTELMQQHPQLWRRHMQMIFQHPSASLNPCLTIRSILEEPFIIHGWPNIQDKDRILIELLDQVGLPKHFLSRLPHELSGGQKQRVAIARALALNPRLVICDEPFSALDASTQVQILHLLAQLHRSRDLSYLIISHDLSILSSFTHRLLIMYRGEIVESAPSKQLYQSPLHPYSHSLINAILPLNPIKNSKKKFAPIKEPPLPTSTTGCPFLNRCPHATNQCHQSKPPLQEIKPNHFVACHLHTPHLPRS